METIADKVSEIKEILNGLKTSQVRAILEIIHDGLEINSIFTVSSEELNNQNNK